jgi:DNA-binding transcriptional MerR regulator
MKVLNTGTVARSAGISERRVRAYADAGLIPSSRDAIGRRVFPPEAVEQARAAFERRTRRPRAA